jgi:hypothetical protein
MIPVGHEVSWQKERNEETRKRRREENKKKNDTNGKYLCEAWYDGCPHIKSFSGGPGDTCGAAKRNVRGGDTSHEASYAVLALQMPPHAVGFFKKAPLAAGGIVICNSTFMVLFSNAILIFF